MRLLPLALVPLASAQSEEFTAVHDKSKINDILAACAENGLAVIDDSNINDVTGLLKGGKYMIAGTDERSGRCLFLDRKGAITKKKCSGRNKFICGSQMARNVEEASTTTSTTSTTTIISTTSTCKASENAPSLDSDHYKFFSTESAFDSLTWHEAREACQELPGDKWDLVVFNRLEEYNYVRNIIVENCINHQSYWVGYKEYNSVPQTVFKKEIPWQFPWSSSEPNDHQGKEDCVRMDMNGEMNDAICKRTWSGNQNDDVGIGYICERQSYLDRCQPKAAEDLPEDNRYFIGDAGPNDWATARSLCTGRGDGWDLVVIDDYKEHSKLIQMANCANHAFWIGVTENAGIMTDINGNVVLYTPWDTHSNVASPEPNDMTGVEECVRMRGNTLNDAKCSLDKTGSPRSGVGMGYICEHDASQAIPNTEVEGTTCEGGTCPLPCGSNLNVNQWVQRAGCPAPASCETGARLKIVDAWKKMQNSVVQYGFVGHIVLPESMANSDSWSILIRFSSLNTKGNFQLWNGKFFNFYNGGYEILIHKKWWDTDRQDSNSFAFVADGLNSPEYPELLTFAGREIRHHCFDSSMHAAAVRGGTASVGAFQTAVIQQAVAIGGRTVRTHNVHQILKEFSEGITKVRVKQQKKTGQTTYNIQANKNQSVPKPIRL